MATLQEWEKDIEKLIKSKRHKEAKQLKAAVDFAKKAHAGAFRKSDNEPYIVHPLEVCIIASGLTEDVDVLIAALLHDVVEDTDFTAEDIRSKFGDRVTSLVADETEDKMANVPKAVSWMMRKEKFIDHLKLAPKEARIICLSDKVSNLRSTYLMKKEKGTKVWDAFNQKDPRCHAWYYRSIGECLRDDFEGMEAFEEYCSLFTGVFGGKLLSYKSEDGAVRLNIDDLKSNDKRLFVKVSGRITSANAGGLYVDFKALMEENPGKEMVYDFDELEMISSAGLRNFMRLKKEGTSFKIINASKEVYDVFEMTGFTTMLDITKAYRRMSVEGYDIIGQGAMGIVYKVDDETVLKVYRHDDIDEIIREREYAKKALVMGAPTAIPFDIVRVGNKMGLVFELLDANSLTKTIIAHPERKSEYIKEYAKILKDLHRIEDDGSYDIFFPKIKDQVIGWAEDIKDEVDETLYDKISAFAHNMRDVKNVLHGDCHPNNVMCTRNGMLMIDMDTLSVGDPLADIAVIYTALIGYKVINPDNDFIPMTQEECRQLWDMFIEDYLADESDERKREIVEGCRKFCYLRLFRRGLRKERDPQFAIKARQELIKAFAD